MGNEKPISIPSMMKRNANEVPNVPALKAKDPETGKEVSCGNYCLIKWNIRYQVINWIERSSSYRNQCNISLQQVVVNLSSSRPHLSQSVFSAAPCQTCLVFAGTFLATPLIKQDKKGSGLEGL